MPCNLTEKEYQAITRALGAENEDERVGIPVCKKVEDLLRRMNEGTRMAKKCTMNWSVARVLGAGAFGIVVLAVRDGKSMVLKFIPDNKLEHSLNTPPEEFRLQEKAHRAGLAPKPLCVDLLMSPKGGAIHVLVMEVATMFDPDDYEVADVEKAVNRLLLDLERIGLTHGDLHPENMCVLSKDDETLRLGAIDFGQASDTVHFPEVDRSQIDSFLGNVSMQEYHQVHERYLQLRRDAEESDWESGDEESDQDERNDWRTSQGPYQRPAKSRRQ